MKLWVFSSKLFSNVQIGYENRMWAVSDKIEDAAFMQLRYTRSRDIHIGSHGLLYCSEKGSQCFTMPFRVLSQPESPTRVVTNVWPEKWALPFKIDPLGSPNRTVHLHVATNLWPILRDVETPDHEKVNAPAVIRGMNGRTQFLPTEISDKDWNLISRDLCFRNDSES